MKVAPKQDYRTPKLLVYGNLSQMTKAMTSGPKNDHSGGNVKTN